MCYDIIGDIHGHADRLVKLLTLMEYTESNGVWSHPDRKAIFVGDFIDRGPKQLESIEIVRRMVENGNALAVMGNHEFNAIAWCEPDPDNAGDFLRSHKNEEYKEQHESFLEEVEDGSDEEMKIIKWFYTLPLWLDLRELRIVHACWHQKFMEYLKPQLTDDWKLKKRLLKEDTNKPEIKDRITPDPSVSKALDAILKGLEIPLPDGLCFKDEHGQCRKEVRTRWWDVRADTYRKAAICDEKLLSQLPDDMIPNHFCLGYESHKPLFIGHYWLPGKPAVISEKVACLDYRLDKGESLVGYRWNGEAKLLSSNLVYQG